MIYRDPKCVYVTDSMGIADVVANWLAHQGLPAKVMNQATLGGLLGLTVFSSYGVSSHGIEVWVEREEDADRTRELVKSYDGFRDESADAKVAMGPVEGTCEECGHQSTFPGEQRGSIQECPACQEHMDVPGNDEAFDWPEDWGEADS